MIRGLAIILFAVLSAGVVRGEETIPSEVLRAERDRIAAVERAIRSAVSVFSPDGSGGGSAVLISSDGFALSNYHVTSPVGSFMKCGLADGELYDAVIVGIDPTGDVALIKLFGSDDFTPAELVDSDRVQVGDWCFAVGNPFLLATDFQPTVTYGIVSGVHRYQYPSGTILEYTDCIQTDAAINPGNSGGPLFNASGELIGINGRGSFEKRGRVNVGVGYAISINQISKFLGHLHSGRVVDHATLGATVDSDLSRRVLVSNILESSDAYRRGLRYGDEIVSFGDRPIDSVNGLKNVLGIYPRGWRVPLSFLRDGERFDIFVRLAGVHGREELLAKIQPRGRPPQRERDGEPDRQRRPHSPTRTKTAPPKELEQFFEARNGFANFYFNRLHRDRVWQAFDGSSDWSARVGVWKLSATTRGDTDIHLELGAEESEGNFGGVLAQIKSAADLSQQLGPRGSGGLLAALHLWRRMLVNGPEQFGDVYYLGKVPLPHHDGLFDVLVATYDVTETHFIFDPSTGQLTAIEMFPDTDVDPCEVYFKDYREAGGGYLPHRWIVRRGGREYAEIDLTKIEYIKAGNSET